MILNAIFLRYSQAWRWTHNGVDVLLTLMLPQHFPLPTQLSTETKATTVNKSHSVMFELQADFVLGSNDGRELRASKV